jgi:hypothetical protein
MIDTDRDSRVKTTYFSNNGFENNQKIKGIAPTTAQVC